MGECLIVRRGGQAYKLPVLSENYPQDVTIVASANGSAAFSVQITEPGNPAEYTYKWYLSGNVISWATGSSVTISGLTAAQTATVYCEVTNKAGTVTSRVATLTVRDWKPAYTYSGSAQFINDGNYNWRIKFLTSGTLRFSSIGNSSGMDIFVVGGGGGGDYRVGGGGGYTKTDYLTLSPNTNYTVTIGAGGAGGRGSAVAVGSGGTTSFHTVSVGGGGAGNYGAKGGNGGSGGSFAAADGDYPDSVAGGSNGSDGLYNPSWDSGKRGIGQGTTTKEFGSSSGTLYASGGGVAGLNNRGSSAAANTGDGGQGSGSPSGGGALQAGSGGSGIVVIRNHR